jgi:hypothetical protein
MASQPLKLTSEKPKIDIRPVPFEIIALGGDTRLENKL